MRATRRWAAAAAAALGVLGVLGVLGCVVAAGPQGAGASTGSGYTTASGGRVGVLPSGLRVFVKRSGPAPDALYAQTRAAVGQVRAAGLPVQFAEWGSPRSGARGVISVRTVTCASPDHLGFMYPRTIYTGWAEVRTAAVIAVCPRAYRTRAVLRATLLGELGRAVGLGTFNGTYEGSTQVLNAMAQPQYDRYRAGDLNGLHYLAAITRAVAPTLVPTAGGLAIDALTNGALRVSGWALNGAENDNPAVVTIRRDGALLTLVTAQVSTAAGRTRAAAKHMTTANDFTYLDPQPAPGTHSYCARLSDPDSLTVTSVSLGCVSAAPDTLTADLLTVSGPDADRTITMTGTAELSGAPDTPLTVTVVAGGLRRGQGSADLATHTYSVVVAAIPVGSYSYCVTVSGGGRTVSAGCAVLPAV
jgi:hypothetical protein